MSLVVVNAFWVWNCVTKVIPWKLPLYHPQAPLWLLRL